VLGPPIALALNKPFFMLRKSGKMPNTLSSKPYKVEYGQRDGLCIPRNAVKKGDRVLLIDDLVATGGVLALSFSFYFPCVGLGRKPQPYFEIRPLAFFSYFEACTLNCPLCSRWDSLSGNRVRENVRWQCC